MKDKIFFLRLQQNDSYLVKLLINIFKQKIEPIYGDQSKAINQILNGADRVCDFFFKEEELPVGLIVYKTFLQNEFNLKNAFELKTVILLNPSKEAGLGKYLLQKAEDEARARKASYIYGTVSKQKPRILSYLQRKGWLILDENKNATVVFKKL